jgi:dTDP-4-dehydrorhamnose reductase
VKLLVTGAAGMLGHEVVAAAERLGHEVHAWDLPECDLTDGDATLAALRRLEPRAVVNCAAYTNVDGAEADEAAAMRVNGDAAGNLAQACAAVGARLVHVSTDYVFDGSKREPWIESDATSPLGAYGRTKLHGEDLVRAGLPDHAIVRTAWLFGPHGKNFVDTMMRLGAELDELTVIDDQIGSPTYTGHLAQALVTIAETRPNGVLHVAGGGRCSWYELARETFARAGMSVNVRPCTTAEYPLPAPRPAFSVLGSSRHDHPTLPPWQEGLAAHLAIRKAHA